MRFFRHDCLIQWNNYPVIGYYSVTLPNGDTYYKFCLLHAVRRADRYERDGY